MSKQESQKNFMRSTMPIVTALIMIIGAVGYIVLRFMSERAYNEKWKDYNDCGMA